VPRQRLAGVAALPAARSIPGRQAEARTVGQRKEDEERQHRPNRGEEGTVTPSRRIQPQVEKHRHVDVVEHEHLVAQHRQASR